MARFRLTGLDGRNPLHFLAALGLLRLGDRIRPGMRLGWSFEGAVRNPVLEPVADFADLERLAESMAAWLRELGSTNPSPPTKAVNLPFGQGIAHLGDIIKAPVGIFRNLGENALRDWFDSVSAGKFPICPVQDDPWLVLQQLTALASEVWLKNGYLKETPLSFGNGGGKQFLLKHFRMLAGNVNRRNLIASLMGGQTRFVIGGTALNWDPSDRRSHALQARDPESTKKIVDVSANVLAYIGLSFVKVVPCRPGFSRILGYISNQKLSKGDSLKDGSVGSFYYPLWERTIPVDLVSVLFSQLDRLTTSVPQNGIREIWGSRIVSCDKRKYFSRPRLIAS